MSSQPGSATPAGGITLSDRDIAAAQELLRRAGEEPALPVLTDEEIVALDGIDNPQAVVLPWLSGHEEQKELACNVALRTLLSKGFVVPVADEPGQVPTRIGADLDLTGVMTLRRSGQKVVVTELTKADDQGEEKVWLYSYLHGDFALQELVDSAGSHAFSFRPLSTLPGALLELANAQGLTGQDGETESLDQDGFTRRATAELADVRGVTTVVVIDSASDDTGNLTIYTGPQDLHALEAADADGQARYLFGKVSADTLAARLSALIATGTAA